jgi:uncharacterized protein (UPF0332 family)
VTPETGELLDKARDCLSRARIILAAGVGEDAGRDAYLAGLHVAQAVIRARTGRIAKTHRGVHGSCHVWDKPIRGLPPSRCSSRKLTT